MTWITVHLPYAPINPALIKVEGTHSQGISVYKVVFESNSKSKLTKGNSFPGKFKHKYSQK